MKKYKVLTHPWFDINCTDWVGHLCRLCMLENDHVTSVDRRKGSWMGTAVPVGQSDTHSLRCAPCWKGDGYADVTVGVAHFKRCRVLCFPNSPCGNQSVLHHRWMLAPVAGDVCVACKLSCWQMGFRFGGRLVSAAFLIHKMRASSRHSGPRCVRCKYRMCHTSFSSFSQSVWLHRLWSNVDYAKNVMLSVSWIHIFGTEVLFMVIPGKTYFSSFHAPTSYQVLNKSSGWVKLVIHVFVSVNGNIKTDNPWEAVWLFC